MQGKKRQRVLYYGGRKSEKLVRCYHKDALGVFRVELELHSNLLRQHSISTLGDFLYLPDVVCPKHLQFVELDWKRLERYLAARFGNEGPRIFAGVKKRATSLQRVRRYLGKHGVVNFHRFLMPHPLNNDVTRALKRWGRRFDSEEQ